MDSVPDLAVCNEAVKLAVKKDSAPARICKTECSAMWREVWIRKISAEAIERLSVVYSMPEWILKLWKKTYDLDAIESMLQAFQEILATIRCNLAKTTPENLKESLQKEGVTVTPHPYLSYAFWIQDYDHLSELESFQKGRVLCPGYQFHAGGRTRRIQRKGSATDVCAAPGGKALHVAEKLRGTGSVEARDLSLYKVGLITENIERSGLMNIHAVQKDATVCDADVKDAANFCDCRSALFRIRGSCKDIFNRSNRTGHQRAGRTAEGDSEKCCVLCPAGRNAQ